MDINSKVDQIKSRDDFALFVRDLLEDFKNNPQSWEHRSLKRFLEGVKFWLEHMEEISTEMNDPSPCELTWKKVGLAFLSAKYY